jgi:hypothetical protein
MQKYISKLPEHIIDYIIPYTYQLQNKVLLEDIQNYTKTKDRILQLYYDLWINYMDDVEPEDKYWIINDIIAYVNDDRAIMCGYVDKFYNIFRRKLSLKTNGDVLTYIENLEQLSTNTQINILWGLLLPNEREDIIIDFIGRNGYFIEE